MLLRYFYNSQLAHASYLLGCPATGEAIVIDPGRAVDDYLAAAQDAGLRVVGAAETHIHADFVSGARELAERTGAALYLSDEGGSAWRYRFAAEYRWQPLRQGTTFNVGRLEVAVVHTPGHTPEHVSFLVTDRAGADAPMGIFTGDFVFVGSVGRPDLLEKVVHQSGTARAGARQLFASLQQFRTLPDYVQVWPAHGAGSLCGKALGAVPSSTVGYEKRFNPALQISDEDAFVAYLLDEQPEPPPYFARMKRANRDGPRVLGGPPAPAWLPAARLGAVVEEGALLIDTRPVEVFAAGHVPGALNIPNTGSFTHWAGWLVPDGVPLYLLAERDAAPGLMRRLADIGLDEVAGCFDPAALAAWQAEGGAAAAYPTYTPAEAAQQVAGGLVQVVDVRRRDEWEAGHLPGAIHRPLEQLALGALDLPRDRPLLLQCRSGARSGIAASLLRARGFTDVGNLASGLAGWQAAGLPVVSD